MSKHFYSTKNIVEFLRDAEVRDYCRDLYKNLKIPPLQSQYVLSFHLFVFNN